VWDTAGQDKFKTIISAYYKGAKVIMFVFDVADQKSLEAVAQWEEEAEQHSNEEPIKILIGNKVDMDRKVTREQAEKFAAEHNMKYYETSAKRGSGIEGLFDEMAVELYDKYKKKPHKSTTDSGKKVRINIPNTKPVGKFSRCC
jgi:small GTP-binding protein